MTGMNASCLKIKAVPGARKSEVVGWLGDALKVRLQAPAEKNQANKELISLLAQTLKVPPRKIRIQRGHRSSNKLVLIDDYDEQSLEKALHTGDLKRA